MRFDVVIVGGGHGGAHTAIALRQRGFDGSIAILTAEPDEPYERPPLSKDYLAGRKPFERLLIRPTDFWKDRAIAIRTNERVVVVDPSERRVTTQSGENIGYGDLVWAAGGEARRLGCNGHNLNGVHLIRSRADVDRLNGEMTVSERVVVIGGGYVGLESAATLTRLGKRVTIVEANSRLLARVAGPAMSRFVENEHASNGVDIRLSAAVARIEGRAGRAHCVVLTDGRVLPADIVIVGIGIQPLVEPLRAAGALVVNGVFVDEQGRTTLPHVYAVGDCAMQPHPCAEGRPIRIESVQNAVDMAGIVAAVLCGEEPANRSVPWFWSHQYGLRLQTIGFGVAHDEEVVHGTIEDGGFSVAYLREGQVIAVDCVNDTKTFVEARHLFSSNISALTRRLGPSAPTAFSERPSIASTILAGTLGSTEVIKRANSQTPIETVP